MLVDELLAYKKGALADVMDVGLDRFKKDLREAQHFVLDPTLTRQADLMPRQETLRVLEFCKVPFPLTWVEFSHHDRPLFPKDTQVQGLGVPSRVGFLAQRISTSPETVRATLCWNNKLYGPNISLVEVEICPTTIPLSLQSDGGWLTYHDLSPYFRNMRIPAHLGDPTVAAGKLFERGKGDWSGEAWFLLAVLALLNAKNGATSEAVSHDKFNRVRRSMGKAPFIDYHLLKLRLDRPTRKAAQEEDGVASEPMRAHVVRGHFKVRKTGIYWWAPHVRGDLARGFAAKRYAVSNAA